MSDTNDIRGMLAESAQRLFADHVDSKMLDAAKKTGWSAALWSELEKAELPLVGIPEAAGGAGGTLSDMTAVLRIAARHAAPAPLAETHLAAWLLASAKLAVPRGPLTIAAGNEKISAVKNGATWRISCALKRVPFARAAKQLVLLGDGHVFAVDATACRITPGRNLASEARDNLALDGVPAFAAAPCALAPEDVRARGALLRAVQIAGALERALDLACEYAKTRTQFGRKIAQFQAIQQEVARAGGEVAAAVAAALSAAGVVERLENHAASDAAPDDAVSQRLLAIASAKIRAADAANVAVAIAHQVHGAIGVTDEYALHHVTLRALAWREEFGNEVFWSMQLGRAMQQAGAEAHWPVVSAA